MPRVKSKIDQRRFDSFVTKLAKAQRLSLSAPVKSEVDSLIRFLVDSVAFNASTIMENYLRKTKTVKPSTLKSALQAHLKGELRLKAIAAGEKAIETSSILKAQRKTEKASQRITGGGGGDDGDGGEEEE